MKFLIDVQLSPALCRWFATKDHHAVHVTDLLPGNTADRSIAHMALTGDRIIVTKDGDFLPIATETGVRVLLLRCGNIRPRPLVSWLEVRWTVIESRLHAREVMVEVR